MKNSKRNRTKSEELAIYNEFNKWMNKGYVLPSQIINMLMKKYSICDSSTFWEIRERVSKRIEMNHIKKHIIEILISAWGILSLLYLMCEIDGSLIEFVLLKTIGVISFIACIAVAKKLEKKGILNYND